MNLMVEMDRAIEIGNFIQYDNRRGFRQLVLGPFLMRDSQRWAWFEALIFGGRFLAGVALQAVELRNVLLQCLCAADG